MRFYFLGKRAAWLISILLTFALGYLAGLWSTGNLPVTGSFSKQMPIFYVKNTNSELSLTFDISWGEHTLPLVLKILEEQQAPATFFISGPWGIRHPDAVKAIIEGGHEIASHGGRHIDLSQYPQAVVAENLQKSHQDLLSVAPKVAPYFRPPNGDYDDLVIDTAREHGFETVLWAVDSLDWKNPGASYMEKRVLQKAFPGAIILFHASDSSKQIHLALPVIIAGLRAKGYKPVLLSELMKNGIPARNDPR